MTLHKLVPHPDQPKRVLISIDAMVHSLLMGGKPDPYVKGRLVLSRDDDGLDVVRADPHILIADEVLAGDMLADYGVRVQTRLPHFVGTGDTVRVEADNRTVIYKVGQYRAEPNVWEAAWPD